MSYSIAAIEEIDADDAKALKSVGIRTTEKLLEAAKSPKGRKFLAAKTELDEKKLLRWANIADKLRIKGMGREYAGLLCAVGVETVKELAAKKNCTPAQFALAWVLAQGNDMIPIPGTKRVKYLEDNLGALGVQLTQADLKETNETFDELKVAGERYTPEMMTMVHR